MAQASPHRSNVQVIKLVTVKFSSNEIIESRVQISVLHESHEVNNWIIFFIYKSIDGRDGV